MALHANASKKQIALPDKKTLRLKSKCCGRKTAQKMGAKILQKLVFGIFVLVKKKPYQAILAQY
jgi:hypothetical protein